MINSVHKTLHRPSIDSENEDERKEAVRYTLETLDCMEKVRIPRMVLHSFSDLPEFLRLKSETANPTGYMIGSNAVKIYGLLAPSLKAYRSSRSERIHDCFMRSLEEIARYAADKRVNGGPIEIAFEEHYSDAIDYDRIPYGRGSLSNVIRCFDTAHHLIRTGHNSDLSNERGPIHFHAVDTNGFIDDHRTLGSGKVDLLPVISTLSEKRLTETIVLENGSRRSALASKDVLLSMIKQTTSASH
jgi:sugar phosphate isomerase/epimerase